MPNPKRSLEEQRRRLLGEAGEDMPVRSRKVLATRGSAPLIGQTHIPTAQYKVKKVSPQTLIICMGTGLITTLATSLFLDFFQALMLGVFVGIVSYILMVQPFKSEKKAVGGFIINEEITFEDLIAKNYHLLNDEGKEVLAQINQQLNYLIPLIDDHMFSPSQQHFVKSCQSKYIPDILNILSKAPHDQLSQPQALSTEQFKKLNGHLKTIIDDNVENINTAIKVRGIFSPD